MPETPAHRRAKKRAAGPGGRTEVPLRGAQRLGALTKGGDELRKLSAAILPQS